MKHNTQLIQYYTPNHPEYGWRTGYVVRRGWKYVRIRKILSYKATTSKPCLNVKLENTREVL